MHGQQNIKNKIKNTFCEETGDFINVIEFGTWTLDG